MTINLDYLLERKQATEDQIVTYLVTHFYEPMRHLALTILHDALAADDVAQETLLKAANRIHQYEPPPPLPSPDPRAPQANSWQNSVLISFCVRDGGAFASE